jgi:hypothetical protein
MEPQSCKACEAGAGQIRSGKVPLRVKGLMTLARMLPWLVGGAPSYKRPRVAGQLWHRWLDFRGLTPGLDRAEGGKDAKVSQRIVANIDIRLAAELRCDGRSHDKASPLRRTEIIRLWEAEKGHLLPWRAHGRSSRAMWESLTSCLVI